MTITDIMKRQGEERKREKRLVHLTNSLSRDFAGEKFLKQKTRAYKNMVDYIIKSFLDYTFFNEHKEIAEINENLIKSFLIDFAPRKLAIKKANAKDVPGTIIHFLEFLHSEGYHKNVNPLQDAVKENRRIFLKAFTKETGPKKKKKRVAISKKTEPVIKVGRNDPCPCGSGKKYKNCCGRVVK